jgi:hypothetical protein
MTESFRLRFAQSDDTFGPPHLGPVTSVVGWNSNAVANFNIAGLFGEKIACGSTTP